MRADESPNLENERIECGKKYQSERAQKHPARGQVTGRACVRAEQAFRYRAEVEVHCRSLYRQNCGRSYLVESRMEVLAAGRLGTRSGSRRFIDPDRDPLCGEISSVRKNAAGTFRSGRAGRAGKAGPRTPERARVLCDARASCHKEDKISPGDKQTIPGHVSSGTHDTAPSNPAQSCDLQSSWVYSVAPNLKRCCFQEVGAEVRPPKSRCDQSAANTCSAWWRSFPRLRLIACMRGRNVSTGGRRIARRSSAIFRRKSWGA